MIAHVVESSRHSSRSPKIVLCMLSPLMIEAKVLQNVLESFVGDGEFLAAGTLVLHEH